MPELTDKIVDDLKMRAIASYIKRGNKDSGFQQPNCAVFREHDGQLYIVVLKSTSKLAAYQIRAVDTAAPYLRRVPFVPAGI